MSKRLLWIGISIALIICGFFALNSYIYNQKQGNNPGSIAAYRGTLTGEFVCLPHKDTEDPQTLECAFGIKTDAGEYYALDFNLMPQGNPDLNTGDRFTASGTITPIEMLSTDFWEKTYDVEGIFSVTDTVLKH